MSALTNTQSQPGFAFDQADQSPEFGRVLNTVLGFTKDDRNQAAAFTQLGQDVAVVGFQRVAVQVGQAGPVKVSRNTGRLAQFLHPFLVHFQKKQKGQLFQIIAVGNAVVTEDIAVVPQALDNGGRLRHIG